MIANVMIYNFIKEPNLIAFYTYSVIAQIDVSFSSI